ncbi:MAG: hypothetical protein KTR35_16250 [Gammaproteobacteria bacterium]|nr:hypothetical protein [Gammaproteobacteria bacterium]
MNAILRSFLTIVGIPTLLATIYYGFVASDIYVSEARFAVRSAKGASAVSGISALLSSTGIPSSGQDSLVVMNYSNSLDMFNEVQAKVPFKEHFSNDDIDVLARLDPEASNREMLEYFGRQVELHRDTLSDVITLKARAFDPQFAQQLASLVIELNENLVNRLSTRIEEDALSSARIAIEEAEARLRKASHSITQFRNQHDSLSPAAESSALLSRVAGIEAQLSETRAQLIEKGAYMRNTSPDIVSLKNRVNALERQLALEKSTAMGGANAPLSNLLEDYQPLVLEEQIAQEHYTATLTTLEVARQDAARKKQYLLTFVQPSLPNSAEEPRRFQKILTVAVFSFLVYLISGLLWSALKDHMGR